jgi:hypothetical protein
MTTITRPATEQVQRAALGGLVRRSAAAFATLPRRMRSRLVEAAISGQLGPDPEVEVGRRTGARV